MKGGIKLPREVFSTDNLIADTGFRKSINFENGIKRTAEWIKQNIINWRNTNGKRT